MWPLEYPWFVSIKRIFRTICHFFSPGVPFILPVLSFVVDALTKYFRVTELVRFKKTDLLLIKPCRPAPSNEEKKNAVTGKYLNT